MGVMLLLVAAVRSGAGAQIAPSPAWARVDSVTPATAPTNYKNASVTISWAPVIDGATGKPWAGYVLKVLACPGWSGVVVRTTTVTLTGCRCGNGGDPHVQSAASGSAGASKPVYFVTRTNGSHNLFIPCNEQHQDPWAKFPPIPNPMNEATREGHVSGLLVKERRIEMPLSYVGIRGTEFIGRYDPGAQRQEIYLINGELVVTPSSTGVATHVTAPTSVVSDGAYVRTSPLSQRTYDLLRSEILRTGTRTPTPAVWNLED